MDQVTKRLQEARDLLIAERDNGGNSKELSVSLTEIETAILWRRADIEKKSPPITDKNPA